MGAAQNITVWNLALSLNPVMEHGMNYQDTKAVGESLVWFLNHSSKKQATI